jgi:hypothetical protein
VKSKIQRPDLLPDTARTIMRLTDEDTMLKLCEAFGGQPVRFPKMHHVTRQHVLCRVISFDALERLARYFDGMYNVYMPRLAELEQADRDAEIIADSEFLNNAELAKKYNMSDRNVRRILKNGLKKPRRVDDRQIAMFEE